MYSFTENGLTSERVFLLWNLVSLFLVIAAVFALLMFCLRGAALKRSGDSLKLSKTGRGYVPVAVDALYGDIAGCGILGRAAAVLSALILAFSALFAYFGGRSLISCFFLLDRGQTPSADVFTTAALFAGLILIAEALRKVLRLIMQFRIYRRANGVGAAVVMTLFSFLFPFLAPVFLFGLKETAAIQ